jgi:hypothetical protein
MVSLLEEGAMKSIGQSQQNQSQKKKKAYRESIDNWSTSLGQEKTYDKFFGRQWWELKFVFNPHSIVKSIARQF